MLCWGVCSELAGLLCEASAGAACPAVQGKPLLVLSGGVQQEAAPQILTVALLPHDGKVNLSSLQVTGASSCMLAAARQDAGCCCKSQRRKTRIQTVCVVSLAWQVCSVLPGHPGWPGALSSCACFSPGLPLLPLRPSNVQKAQAECSWLQTAQPGGAA